MRLESLSLHDFKSYAHQGVDLSAVRLASIVGPNGAGKSSLLEATVFALFGGRGLRNLDSFIRQGCEECRVSLTFSMARQRYRITRTRSSRGSGKSTVELAREEEGLWVAEGSGPRETDEQISRILAVDEDTLLLTSIVGQGDAGSFFALQPAKRLEAFGEILKLDEQYGPLEHAWKAEAEDLKAQLEDARRDTLRLEDDVALMDSRQQELAEAKKTLETAQAELKEAETNLENARTVAEKARAIARDLERARRLFAERDRLTEEIAAKALLEGSLAQRNELRRKAEDLEAEERESAELSKQRAVLEADLRAARDALGGISKAGKPKAEEASRLADEVKSLENRLATIKTAEAPTCDRCGQPITDEALSRTIEQLESELEQTIERRAITTHQVEDLRAQFAQQEEQTKALEERVQDLPVCSFSPESLQKVRHELAALEAVPARLAAIEAAEARLAELGQETQELDFQEEDAEQVAQDQVAADVEQKRQEELVEASRRRLTEQEKAKARHEEAIALLGKSQERLGELRSESRGLEETLADAELLRKAFSKWGIPALVVANVLAALEREVNELLGLYDGGLAVRFESERETRDGSRNSLEILVYDGGDWRAFETYSGGEKYRVASAMRLGLALLLAHRAGARVETLIVDEPEGLDAAGRAHLARILERLSEHFGLTLLLTHYDDLKEATPSQVLVSRGEDGLSRVEVVA